MRFWPVSIPVAVAAALILAATAALAASYSLFGDAQIVSPGHNSPHAVELKTDVGNTDPSDDFGGVDFAIPAGTTFADLDQLSTDYMFTQGSCGGGSPRFQVNVQSPDATDTGNIFVYIGPPPNYTGCAANVWVNTGDLLEGVNPIDTTQLNLGAFYDPYAAALVKYGDYIVTGVQVVADSFNAAGAHTVQADNVRVGDALYTFDQPQNKDECKKGGWQGLTRADGSTFKNQGDCIQYVNTGK